MHVHAALGDDNDLSDKVPMIYSTVLLCSSICLSEERRQCQALAAWCKTEHEELQHDLKNICCKVIGVVLDSVYYWNSRTLQNLHGKK